MRDTAYLVRRCFMHVAAFVSPTNMIVIGWAQGLGRSDTLNVGLYCLKVHETITVHHSEICFFHFHFSLLIPDFEIEILQFDFRLQKHYIQL